MIKSYQEREALTKTGAVQSNIATVYGVHGDGISLILPGSDTPTEKHYPFNAACGFAPGDRVHICREGGTIIVEYPLGGTKNADNI